MGYLAFLGEPFIAAVPARFSRVCLLSGCPSAGQSLTDIQVRRGGRSSHPPPHKCYLTAQDSVAAMNRYIPKPGSNINHSDEGEPGEGRRYRIDEEKTNLRGT